MSQQTKQELVERMKVRYARMGRRGKSRMLDEFGALTGHSRKHAIKLLRGTRGRKRPAGRKRRYGDEVTEVLRTVWQWTDQMCSKHLKAALPEWLPYVEREQGRLPDDLRQKVLSICPAQIDRLLKPYRVQTPAWRHRGPKPGTLIRQQVPIRAGPWTCDQPGWMEVDTVAHCGGSLVGNFIWSLTLTDISSGWTCLAAVWNRGAHGVLEQIRQAEARLPFRLRGFDSDNGGEFLNAHLWAYLRKRPQPVEMTRSRPYRKNDNAHVEQKNWTHVRQLLGYERLENSAWVQPINELYTTAWELYHNFFRPTQRLIRKERIGSRYRKFYDDPRTPYDRLMHNPGLSRAQKRHLSEMKKRLNPLVLKRRTEDLLKPIFSGVESAQVKSEINPMTDRFGVRYSESTYRPTRLTPGVAY